MFNKIMVPVDLAHAKSLARALKCAADLAVQNDAEIVFVGVTASAPGPVAHNPKEFREKLDAFAAGQASAHGTRTKGHAVESHDPAVDKDKMLMKALKDTGADLVVMQTHTPGLADYFFEGHGPHLAHHAKASVMLVRD